MSETPPTSGRVGTFDSRYQYDHIFPRGRSGETLRAWIPDDNNRLVVIKRPAPQDAPPMRAAQEVSIKTERKALERLTGHPALTELRGKGSFRVGGQSHEYIVMERAEGTIIEDLVLELSQTGERLPMLEMLVIIDELLDLLVVAHEQQVVYNDVDAKHLFWNRDHYRLKVIDWGNAVLLDENNPQHITRQADVHQVGQLLYFIITGGKRFDSETSPDGEYAVIFGLDAPTAPPQLLNIITQATHPNIRRRYSTIIELRQSLSEIRRPLEEKRQNILRDIETALLENNSQHRLQELDEKLTEAATMDVGYPKVHTLREAIENQRLKVQTQANIDAGRIYIDTANWPRAIETMLDLLHEADAETAQTLRFIIAAVELMDQQGLSEAPAEFSPALDEILRGDAQHAGWILHNTSSSINQLLADRLCTYIPEVTLLRPAIARLEVDSQQHALTAIAPHVADIQATLNQQFDEPSLKNTLQQYQQLDEQFAALYQALQPLAADESLLDVVQRATQYTKTLIHHLQVVSSNVYSNSEKALAAIESAARIDPINSAFQELEHYFEEIHLTVDAIANFKPDEQGTELKSWLERVINVLQNFADDVTDQALRTALQDLQTTQQLWETVFEALIIGNRVNINSYFIRIARQISQLNPMISQWARDRGDAIRRVEHTESLSPNQPLAKRIIEAYRLWDNGKLRDAGYQAEGAFTLAKTEGELQAVKKLSELSAIPANWVESKGIDNYELTQRTEKAILSLFTTEEQQLLERFTGQMKSENAYLNSMQRGLIDPIRLESTSSTRVLLLNYIFQGILCVQEDDLRGATFWQQAAQKVAPNADENPAYAAFSTRLDARKLILEAEEVLNNVHQVSGLKSAQALLQHPLANQWLGDIQTGLRQLEAAIKQWEDGEFKSARDTFETAHNAIQNGAKEVKIKLDVFLAWIDGLRDTANLLQSKRLAVEEIAHTTSIPAPGEMLAIDPAVEQHLMTIVVQTEETLGADYVHQMRQWLSTYQAVMYTYMKDLPKADKLQEFQSHFANLFINRHPTFRLYQIWREVTQNSPETTAAPAATYASPSTITRPDSSPTNTPPSSPAPAEPSFAPDDRPDFVDNTPDHDVQFDDGYETNTSNNSIPWGIIAAIGVVLAGVIAFALFGGFGESGDSPNNSAANGSNNDAPAVLVSNTPTPSDTPDFTPTFTVTASPTPSLTATTEEAPSNTPSLTATDIPSETPTDVPTATTAPTETPTTPTATPERGAEETVVVAADTPLSPDDLLAFDFLAALNESDTSTYSWNSVWFYNAVGGPWQLGEISETSQSGPVVVKLAPEDMAALTQLDDAAERLQAIEIELTLRLPQYDDAEAIGSGVYFGIGVENENLERIAAEVLVARPNAIDIGVRENDRYNSLTGFPESNFTVTLSIERDATGTLTMRFRGQDLPYEAETLYPLGTPMIPVLYTSRGGVVITVSQIEFSFADAE